MSGANKRHKTFNLFESVIHDGRHEFKLLNEIIHPPEAFKDQQPTNLHSDKNILMEESSYSKKGLLKETIRMHIKALNRSIYLNLKHKGPTINMKFGVQWDSKDTTNGSTEKLGNQINLELRPKTNVKDELALSMEYNSIKIFDGWFYLSEDLQKLVKQYFPLALNYKIDNLTKHQQTIAQLLA